MYKYLLLSCITLLLFRQVHAQLAPLTVEKIMRDPKWMGTQPGTPSWSEDSRTIYFSWNPDNLPSDSTYGWKLEQGKAYKLSFLEKNNLVEPDEYLYNASRTKAIYSLNGDLYLYTPSNAASQRITMTSESEIPVQWMPGDSMVAFQRGNNLYALHLTNGFLKQLTFFESESSRPRNNERDNEQEAWLKTDQLELFEVLKDRKIDRDAATKYRDAERKATSQKTISLEGKSIAAMNLSPNGRFVSYRLFNRNGAGKSTIVPSYVTESGFTEDLSARSKVGAFPNTAEAWIYDRQRDTAYRIITDSIPGIRDIPSYMEDYPNRLEERKKKNAIRSVTVGNTWWNTPGNQAVINITASNNKDRWLMLLDPVSGKMKTLDRQHDEAWIGGPGVGAFGATGGWINDHLFYFQSEASGYSHLQVCDTRTMAIKALTEGNFEIQSVALSRDKKHFYLTANKVHPGEKHLYRIPVNGGPMVQLTSMQGANEAVISPDEKWLAIRYSAGNKPWELFLQPNQPGAVAKQLTEKAMSPEFRSYAWRDPQVVTFKAEDGATVYARLYKPEKPHPSKPAVIFVHGAGYLQNAHRWWSSYFREYMFHNLLADEGYTVLDIDYRASAGYGRDWRTGIYRWMGGKDLTDQVDGARFLVEQHGVDAQRIGIYGGSYGGFITLMALFTKPGTFAAGAALRPVTDWAHYNHGYTSNILNTPLEDSIAYRKSSPIYHAEGLQDNLLICHGMLDVNVHFQDVVRLQQRLIELGKDKWELAAYPMEDHGFVEPSSWTDEYKRIYTLFERVLKKP